MDGTTCAERQLQRDPRVLGCKAADWLESNADGRTLLTPASPFGDMVGEAEDEQLQPLLRSPWAVRNVIPLTPGANIDMLDAVSRQLATGREPPSWPHT